MKFCFFQHDLSESPGTILDWVKEKGHKACFVNFYEEATLPEQNEIDALIIMGGPMNVGDEADEYSWLEAEGEYIQQFIKSGKKTFGICLGSQMISDALGAKVYRNEHTEIGWHKVTVDQSKIPAKFSGIFLNEFITFHWHSYTFEIPENYTNFVSSEATKNQAFIHNNVAAFQFHPEMTKDGILKLVRQNKDVFKNGYPFVQSTEDIIETNNYFEVNNTILYKFLDRFFDEER
jgi:GMP synthase-like glutamine amidotransferase